MTTIYCDGVFDLFHSGHVNHFKKIKEKFDNVFLIVGIVSDKDATEYKRKPIYDENERYTLVSSCKYVNQVIMPCPMVVTGQFMTEHKIHYVAHAFANESDIEKQKEFFEMPMRLGKFLSIEYNKEISTTEIIERFKKG